MKIGTPKMNSAIVPKMEQFCFTVQLYIQNMQMEGRVL